MSKNNMRAITNSDPDFYSYLGSIFGSREVERVTGDRFYDDDNKEWHIHFGEDGVPDAYASVAGAKIKNVYALNNDALVLLLGVLLPQVAGGVAPIVYADQFLKAGFKVEDGGYKKFIKVKGAAEDESKNRRTSEKAGSRNKRH